MTDEHFDKFTDVDGSTAPCCGPHILHGTPRLVVSFCVERGWRFYIDEKLLFRLDIDDSEYEDALGDVEPTSHITSQEDDEPAVDVQECVEDHIATNVAEFLATYIETPGTAFYRPGRRMAQPST